MIFSDPGAGFTALMLSTPSQRLGLALLLGGASLVLLSVMMRLARKKVKVRSR